MKNRIITGSAMVVALIGFFYLGKTALFYLLLTVNAFALAEYMSLVYKQDAIDFSIAALLGTALIVGSRLLGEAAILPLYTASCLIFVIKDIVRGQNSFAVVAMGVWGFTAVSLSIAFAVLILEKSLALCAMIILSTSCCDISAYFAGTFFGNHPIAPNISPHKTLEGSLAGCIAAMAVFGLAAAFAPLGFSGLFAVSSGICCGAFSQFGDLAMSMAKRHYGAKDFSSLLPGHGGVLDRIDAMLFSFSSMYCLIRVFGL